MRHFSIESELKRFIKCGKKLVRLSYVSLIIVFMPQRADLTPQFEHQFSQDFIVVLALPELRELWKALEQANDLTSNKNSSKMSLITTSAIKLLILTLYGELR